LSVNQFWRKAAVRILKITPYEKMRLIVLSYKKYFLNQYNPGASSTVKRSVTCWKIRRQAALHRTLNH